MKLYDSFFSYSSEDERIASEIVGALKSRGFKIWYAPVNISVGDEIYNSIQNGLSNSNSGILLVSKSYLSRPWTKQEMSLLLKQHIEVDKDIFPIWHDVERTDISDPALANVQALNTSSDMRTLIDGLSKALSRFSPTVGKLPCYEEPVHRFLNGRCEMFIGEDEKATTIWEFLIHAKDGDYPLFFEGNTFTKKDLLFEIARLLPHIPNEIEKWVGKDGREKLEKMCIDAGYDPCDF